jgi:hypothetical protein
MNCVQILDLASESTDEAAQNKHNSFLTLGRMILLTLWKSRCAACGDRIFLHHNFHVYVQHGKSNTVVPVIGNGIGGLKFNCS